MYLRKRNSNISIEKAIYTPAQKDDQGCVTKAVVRSTRYLGSVKVWTQFKDVPQKILQELSAEETAELQRELAPNQPKEFSALERLSYALSSASNDLQGCVAKYGLEEAKKVLEARMKAADDAWSAFFKTAQDLGLKRKPRRAKPDVA
jgi:hypothetical protein